MKPRLWQAVRSVVIPSFVGMPALAGEIVVPTDYPTIQQAIDAATSGDSLLVLPGTYSENLVVQGKQLFVRSSGGAAGTVVDGNQSGRVVYVHGSGGDLTLTGFTLRNGATDELGGGLLCEAKTSLFDCILELNTARVGGAGAAARTGTLTIERCEIRDNVAGLPNSNSYGGGVVAVNESDLVLRDSRIERNFADGEFLPGLGGGVFALDSTASVTGCEFRANRSTSGQDGIVLELGADGAYVVRHNWFDDDAGNEIALEQTLNTVIEHNRISTGSKGSAVQVLLSSALIRDCEMTASANPDPGVKGQFAGETLVERCTLSGFATGLLDGFLSSFRVRQSVIWGNGTSIAASAVVTYSDIQGGWTGAGNINLDPAFVDPASGDYRLSAGSPCIDSGDPAYLAPGADLDGNARVLDGNLDRTMVRDMGALEFTNLRLTVTGDVTPGGTVTIDTSGTPGLRAFLYVAFVPATLHAPPYGTRFFDLTGPWLLLNWGTVPSSVQATIPASTPAPLTLILQEVALDASKKPAPGNLSNAVTLRIE